MEKNNEGKGVNRPGGGGGALLGPWDKWGTGAACLDRETRIEPVSRKGKRKNKVGLVWTLGGKVSNVPPRTQKDLTPGTKNNGGRSWVGEEGGNGGGGGGVGGGGSQERGRGGGGGGGGGGGAGEGGSGGGREGARERGGWGGWEGENRRPSSVGRYWVNGGGVVGGEGGGGGVWGGDGGVESCLGEVFLKCGEMAMRGGGGKWGGGGKEGPAWERK